MNLVTEVGFAATPKCMTTPVPSYQLTRYFTDFIKTFVGALRPDYLSRYTIIHILFFSYCSPIVHFFEVFNSSVTKMCSCQTVIRNDILTSNHYNNKLCSYF